MRDWNTLKMSLFKSASNPKMKRSIEFEMVGFEFTAKQEYAIRQMIQGRNIFITGQAGVGKSFLINQFIDFYRKNMQQENKKLFVTSLTGISALIIGGQTIHRYCSIGTGEKNIDDLVKSIFKNIVAKKRYLDTQVLIIDEISMMSPALFDKIDLIFRRIRKVDLPFGGIQLIVSGDLLQLPPVKADGFVIDSFNWDECIDETIYLTEVMRQNESTFIDVLNKIRIGTVDDEVRRVLESRRGVEAINDYGVLPSNLFSRRVMVQRMNNDELTKLKMEGETVHNFKCIYEFSKTILETNKEFMKVLMNENCDIDDDIELTAKCQVMLKVNLPELKLANGSRGVVIGFGSITGYPIVRFLDGREMEIGPHVWKFEEKDKVMVIKSQIPLQLAFALSIHKAQGSTLEYVVLDIGSDIFECGQTYVALSRVKTLDGLFIRGDIDYTKIRANPHILEFYQRIKV